MKERISILALTLLLSGCVKQIGSGPSGVGGIGVDGAYALAVAVSSSWESELDPKVVHQVCSIPIDAPIPTLEQDCEVSLPQGKLFYGDLHFVVSTLSSNCARVQFNPYYYRASKAVTFTPEWAPTATLDCSSPNWTKVPHDCFNGPVFQFNPDFPLHYGRYYIPQAQGSTQTYDMPSANSENRKSNRWASNELPVNKRNLVLSLPNGSDGYEPGFDTITGQPAFEDYRLICFDQWDQDTYSIRITVKDTDTSSSPIPSNIPFINKHPDWDSLLDPQ